MTTPLTTLSTLLIFALSLVSTPANAKEKKATLAQQLCAGYEQIQSVSCEIRKIATSDTITVRMLSRVHYRKPGRIHVDSVAPIKKRIISDGKTLYYHQENAERGFSRPVAKLEEPILSTYRNIPATPMEHLLKLRDLPEADLPGDKDLPVRKGYQAPKVYVVLAADAEGKLVRVEFYASSEMKSKTALYEYSDFHKAGDNCWIPLLHKATMFLPDGKQATEIRHIDNLFVNKPVADNLFNPDLFFKDLEFVDDFSKTFSR
jgi:hypothetical protein